MKGALEATPPVASGPVDAQSPTSEQPGERIGRYKLLEKIGEGGCGVVYMAEQEEPVRRRVALKVIKPGMDTREVIARFEAERQALALMEHPHIAKVFDGGATEAGRPYFVMELVRGLRITDYCDQKNLSTRQRLDLFMQVCQAVQHAHQKGIIHRDLKPSNILVTVNDGAPVPKVIDFGIAKANGPALTDKTFFTRFQQLIGTPAYMSPEQAEMTSVDIDTRSDIYSLGVLLYELLTGRTPFDSKELLDAGMESMLRTIREKEPLRPSARLNTLAAIEQTTVAQQRHTDAPKLINLVRGDLDWIVIKCLEKDRARRYETANGVAADIERHLDNDTVSARPPNAVYRLQKLIRRNKLAFSAAAAVVLALVVGIVLSTWQAIRATQAERRAQAEAQRATTAEKVSRQRLTESEEARARADAISQFITDVFITPVGPSVGGRSGRSVTVVDALGEAKKRLETDQKLPPKERVELLASIGFTYWYLGLESEGLELVEKELEYYRTTFGPTDEKTLGKAMGLTELYADSKRTDKAIKLGEETLQHMRPEQGTPLLLKYLGKAYEQAGRTDDALATWREAVRVWSIRYPDDFDPMFTVSSLANCCEKAGHKDEALKLREQILAGWRKKNPKLVEGYRLNLSHFMLEAMHQLAGSYYDAGRRDEAIKLEEEAATWLRKIFGSQDEWAILAAERLENWHPDNPKYSKPTLAVLTERFSRSGKFAEAAQSARRIIERGGLELSSGKGESIQQMILAGTLLAAGDREGYRAACADAVRRFKETTDAEHAGRVAMSCLLAPDSTVDAATLAFVAIAQSSHSNHYVQLVNALVLYRLGHADVAADRALRLRADPTAPEHVTAAAAAVLAMSELIRQHPEEARSALNISRILLWTNWPKGANTDWYEWLIADLLAKEAQTLLNGSASAPKL